MTERREVLRFGEDGTHKIKEVNALHDDVTKHFTTLEQRTISYVLHSEKNEVSVGPNRSIKD